MVTRLLNVEFNNRFSLIFFSHIVKTYEADENDGYYTGDDHSHNHFQRDHVQI